MPVKNTLEGKIAYRVKRSKTPVFVRDDFKDIGGYDQVGRVLRGLVRKDLLVNLGYGTYARSKKSSVSGAVVPERPLPELAKELLKKLGVEIVPSSAEKAYNSGISTQVPTGRVSGVKGRIARRIGYNGRYISFEKVAQ
jgi:hypothetical protein